MLRSSKLWLATASVLIALSPTFGSAQSSGAGAGSTGKSGSRSLQSLDFKDAPIEDVVRAISELTGKNFILDPGVKGQISIVAPSSVSVEEAYRAFLSALAINNLTVVQSGKFFKVMPAQKAQRDNIETSSKGSAPTTDQMVTRIIKLEHLSASEVIRSLKNLVSRDGDITGYDPTNSLILTDYGSNIRRIMKIIAELDKPGSNEQMAVIPIRYAKAKDLAAMIEKVAGGGGKGASRPGSPFPSAPRFRGPASIGGGGFDDEGNASLSFVTPDERTNSLVVLGNQQGIEKVKTLVEELDFNIDPASGGGAFVYRLKHALAKNVAETLNGIATSASQASKAAPEASANRPYVPPGSTAVFGGDVKIAAEPNTNSLIIVAGKQDYDVVKSLIAQIDIPRDQVYVEAVIMEVNSDKTRDWKVGAYYLEPSSGGIVRNGFASPGILESLFDRTGDSGLVLGGGTGDRFEIKIGENVFQIPSVIGFIKFLQQNAEANILSTPQILAMDNEEAMIEVGDNIPIGLDVVATQNGATLQQPRFERATIKLTIRPHVSPGSDSIRMSIEQIVKQPSDAPVRGKVLSEIASSISERSLKTSITVDNNNTIVLGGLIREEESQTITKVPFLGDIPILGWLFRADTRRKKKVNLLVFLTPKIVRSGEASRALLGSKLDARKRWLDLSDNGKDPFAEKVEELLRTPPAPVAPEPSPETAPAEGRAPASVAPPEASPPPEVAPPADQPPTAPETLPNGEPGVIPAPAPEAAQDPTPETPTEETAAETLSIDADPVTLATKGLPRLLRPASRGAHPVP